MKERITLKNLRKKNGFTQRDLAALLDVSPATVGLWESGQRIPTLKRAIEIGDLFGVPVECISFSDSQLNKH